MKIRFKYKYICDFPSKYGMPQKSESIGVNTRFPHPSWTDHRTFFELCEHIPAAILGTIYLYARRNYSKGYIEAADKRVTPFWQSIWALKGLVVVGVAGIVNTGLREYAGLDLVARLREVAF
ncbi:MGST2-like protein [Mya arenaria]|uniref:MGST2-like protein n=1 Tax=Mya arenaria TaxID=6604 RepID=A0ABY7DQH1_MYAAR|nr:MGST2-like protein [Mya arenaria]